MIRERVIAGLEAARARGHHGGRRPKLTADDEAFRREMAQAGMPITKIAARLKCSRHTIYKSLAVHQPVQAGGGGLEVAPHGVHLYRYALCLIKGASVTLSCSTTRNSIMPRPRLYPSVAARQHAFRTRRRRAALAPAVPCRQFGPHQASNCSDWQAVAALLPRHAG